MANYSEEMTKVLEAAAQVARQYQFSHIGSEHIFYCILKYPDDTLSKQLLADFGFNIEKVCFDLESMFVENEGESD